MVLVRRLGAGLLSLVFLGAGHGCVTLNRKAPASECPMPPISDARIRQIGYAAAREYEPALPKEPPADVRVGRSGCNYFYTEVYDEKEVGSFLTVLIAPDGRVLGVAPGL